MNAIERWKRAETIELASGGHETREDGLCVMEAVAYVAGEKHSDHPQCSCPVIAAFLRAWNDALSAEDRNRLLRPLVPRLLNTRSTPEVELQRSWMALDWLVRTHAVAWLTLVPSLREHARHLSACVAIDSIEKLQAAQPKLATARAAAWAAAKDAARAAAWDAARDAARDAAWAAAGDAARDAAGDAARAAAGDALTPTVRKLQESALDLIERMLKCAPEDSELEHP